MRPMTTLKSLLAAVLLTIGCGGGSKPATTPAPDPVPDQVAPAPTEPAAPDPVPEAKPPEPAPVLAFGAGKIKLEERGQLVAEIALNADGTFVGTAHEPAKPTKAKAKAKAKPVTKKKAGKLAERAAFFDGKEGARLAEDGTVTVLRGSKEIQDGKVVKDESSWNKVGMLDAAGVFTGDTNKVSFGDDGKAVGLPPSMTVTFEGAPELRRTAVFLVVAMLSGGTTTMSSGSATAPGNVTAPAPTK
jgi:hypothetical protein